MSGNGGWIGVDLDGTLAFYDKWEGADVIGEPVEAMVKRVKRWLAEGKDVRIFTARVANPDGSVARAAEALLARHAIARWCNEHLGRVLPITNVKDFAMIELWDDRAVQVEANTGKVVGHSTRGLF